MELIDYTNKWLAGEIFEGKSILAAGICLLALTFIVWRTGSTEHARAILLPMLVVAVLHIGIGGSMIVSNSQRIPQFTEQYQRQTRQEYIASENARVNGFMSVYHQVILYIVVASLQQSHKQALNIFAHIAGLGQNSGINNGKWHFEQFGDCFGE